MVREPFHDDHGSVAEPVLAQVRLKAPGNLRVRLDSDEPSGWADPGRCHGREYPGVGTDVDHDLAQRRPEAVRRPVLPPSEDLPKGDVLRGRPVEGEREPADRERADGRSVASPDAPRRETEER